MDSNHRPHDYQSCALASWAIGPYRRNQSHNLRIFRKREMLACAFVSPLPIKPASLGFNGVPIYFFRYIFSAPSKLNNASSTFYLVLTLGRYK